MSTDAAYRAELDRLRKGFAENVRRLRSAKDPVQNKPIYSQEDLSRDSGLHRTQIQKIETGKVEPRLSTLLILADALGASINDLVEGLAVPKERKPYPQARKR